MERNNDLINIQITMEVNGIYFDSSIVGYIHTDRQRQIYGCQHRCVGLAQQFLLIEKCPNWQNPLRRSAQSIANTQKWQKLSVFLILVNPDDLLT